MPSKLTRTQGTVTGWNDERGYGFIISDLPNRRAFFHISAFRSGGRPVDGDEVTYTVDTDAHGRERASHVTGSARGLYRSGAPQNRTGSAHTAGIGSLAPVVLLISGYFVADRIWFLPSWLPWLYLVASTITFLVYADDKRRAKQNAQRISESTLLVLGFACGWPGAIVAQLMFRHKTMKRSFRAPFWGTVVVNLLVVVPLVAAVMIS